MEKTLGFSFMNDYAGPMSIDSQYLADLLTWNEASIKQPLGSFPLKEPQYLATLSKPISNEQVRLSYMLTSGAMPHITTWLAMSEDERRDLLMRRLRRIK